MSALAGSEPVETTGPEVSDGGSTNALGGTVSQPTETNENPAWTPYLEKFPDTVKHIARETFSEWDKNVQKRFTDIHTQYAPYKQFADQGVNAEDLQSAWGVATLLQSDPQGFAEMLAQHLGLTIAQAQQATQQLQEQQEEETPAENPELLAIRESQERLLAYVQEQENQKIVDREEENLTNELAALEQQYGAMIPEVKNQVLAEALRLSQVTGKPVTMQQAYQSLENFVAAVRKAPSPSRIAPRVLSSGSSVPVAPAGKSMGQMTGKETRATVAEYVARLQAGEQPN